MFGTLNRVNYDVGYFSVGNSNKIILCIGGLTNNLFNHQLFNLLADHLHNEYQVVIAQLRSSGYGFGVCTIDDDVDDIEQIIQQIIRGQEVHEIFIIGHSTGCQDIMRMYEKQVHLKYPIKKCVLQAPVSDRDSVRNDLEVIREKKRLLKKYQMKEEDLSQSTTNDEKIELCQYKYCSIVPLLERRFISLFMRKGNEDFFSEDMKKTEIIERYRNVSLPSLFVFSMKDQYIPLDNTQYNLLINKIKELNSNIQVEQIQDNHEISEKGIEFITKIKCFIESNTTN
ncbi:hypothetical protein, conserved [Entamoeba dispar SAW760]|uniref:Uncharacterized protein n=1 Tax=Entamoeba dispar (strain ATCC PRA-260 / SAW760) TaxID=370354 RepID=B0EF32_ENTDS|nr:uncharacterized protein EDI_085830 [Entamoeba dispar SAW760]EDR26881.1 hypothetical protein, conserved [Entamoeba dispar SAW760]|eukprot:EDR26881.1 hypothetical protein, conserved [Entamoeba dispar SAW760]